MAAGDLTSLANVKQWLNIDKTIDDALLQRLLSAASGFAQTWINRQFASQAYTEMRDGSGMGAGRYLMLFANTPVTAVQSLIVDTFAIPASPDNGQLQPGYGFDGTSIWLTGAGGSLGFRGSGYAFTRGRRNVVLAYTAGYSSTPLEIEQAVIELVGLRYREKERIGQVSKSIAGEVVTFSQKDMSDDIKTLFEAYKVRVPL